MLLEYTDKNNDNIKWTKPDGTELFSRLSGNGEIPDQINELIKNGEIVSPYVVPTITAKQQAKIDLAISDSKMPRTVDDLIAALILKGVIVMRDLGQISQDRLVKRNDDRTKLI